MLKQTLALIISLFIAVGMFAAPAQASQSSDAYTMLNNRKPIHTNDASLRDLAQQRAESLAKQDRDTSTATVDSGIPSSLVSKGYGSSSYLKGRSTEGAQAVVNNWIGSSYASAITSPTYNRLGVGVAKSKTGFTYVYALYAHYEKPVVVKAKPKPVVTSKKVATKPVSKPKVVVKSTPKPKPVSTPKTVVKSTPKPTAPKKTTAPKPTKKATPTKKTEPKKTASKPSESPKATPTPSPTPDPRLKEQEMKLTAAEQRASEAEENRLAAEQERENAEAKRVLAEKRAVAVKAGVKQTAGIGANGLLVIGGLVLVGAANIRRKPLVAVPKAPEGLSDDL